MKANPENRPVRYEYESEYSGTADIDKILSDRGKAGWKLFCVVKTTDGYRHYWERIVDA